MYVGELTLGGGKTTHEFDIACVCMYVWMNDGGLRTLLKVTIGGCGEILIGWVGVLLMRVREAFLNDVWVYVESGEGKFKVMCF